MRFLDIYLLVYKIINAKNCTLPSTFEYGNLEVLNNPSDNLEDTQIKIICNEGFKPYPSDLTTCQDVLSGKASCIKTCPSIKPPGIGVAVSCLYDGKETSCENPYAGTTVIYKCVGFYENRNENERRVFVCQFGFWNFKPEYNCQPRCGKKFVPPNKLIVGGRDAEENEFVWNLAVYYTKNLQRQICGGTIITPKVSLSAAHCFLKYVTENEPRNYVVGAGKMYRKYFDSRDNNNNTQYKTLSNIILPEYFSPGSNSRLENDIAILILENPFIMTSYVLPACVDQNGLFNHDLLAKNNGTVVGWGWTEANKPSDHLKVLNVEYATPQKCILHHKYRKYYYPYVQDKICAGLYNQGKSACKGDSGSGLVFPADDGRYYLRGIVSIAPKPNSEPCDTNRYTLYTSVAYHLDLINQQIDQFADLSDADKDTEKIEPYENGCIIPQIENGRVTDRKQEYLPGSDDDIPLDIGSPVPNGTALYYNCANGFLKWESHFIKCINGEWTDAICRQLCDVYLPFLPTTNYECYNNDKRIPCGFTSNGAVMKITCKPGYIYSSDVTTPFAYCINGLWNIEAESYCRLPCGLDYGEGPREIAPNEGPTTFAEFPWHVGIYTFEDYTYLCSGVYFEANYIVTVRNCVESYDASDLIITIGNTYRLIDSDRIDTGAMYEVAAIDRASEIAKATLLDISDSVSFLRFSNLLGAVTQLDDENIFFRAPVRHPVCDGKVDYKFNQPGFFVSWEDPYSLDNYFDQLYKIQVIIREPKVCNVSLAEGVCIEVVGKPICQRATGGAFVFKDHHERYSLVGLAVTTPPKGKECNVTHMVVDLLY